MRTEKKFYIAFIATLFQFITTIEGRFYTAGVVEFRPSIYGMTSAAILAEHLQAYLEIIASPEASPTDILVFPEGTLNGVLQTTPVPDGQDRVLLCRNSTLTEFADFLVQLSCAAEKTRKYLVVNVVEQQQCSVTPDDPRPCASSGANIFNTNVVFDRAGRIISRYRKMNIYLEAKNTTFEPEYGIFDTDFGVRFGHFICFDILFYTPAQELVKRYGISNFVFTSFFFSELPFLTAVQLQQSWAWGNNVNLLAAGASLPQSGATGSGIFGGASGSLVSTTVFGQGIRQLLVARVSKTPGENLDHAARETSTKTSNLKLLRDPEIENFTSELLELGGGVVYRHLCSGKLCCDFHMELVPMEGRSSAAFYRHRIGVFSGQRSYERKDEWSDLRICAIYTCLDENVGSCGEVFHPNETVRPRLLFRSVRIEGQFPRTSQALLMPTSLNDRFESFNANAVDWTVTQQGNTCWVQYSLITVQSNLLTFGIYGNYFKSSATSRCGSGVLSLATVFFLICRSVIWRLTERETLAMHRNQFR